MNYNSNLTELCNALEGSAKTSKQRKEILAQLHDYLENPGYRQQLNSNHGKSGAVQWSHIFNALNKITFEAAERHLCDTEKKGKTSRDYTAHQDVVIRCSSALRDVAFAANAGKPLLPCRDLISCCLDAFEQPRFRGILSEAYLEIILKSVLCKKEYWSEIDSETLIDLSKALQVLFSETTGKTKITILSCINLICFHGSRLSGFIEELRRMLQFASSLLVDTISNLFSLQSSALQLCLTLCRQLKREFRITVGKFGEQIMPLLIGMFEASCGDIRNKKILLYQLVYEIVSVHHPCGVLSKLPGSYAHDLETWYSSLKNILRCLSEELDSRMMIARIDSDMDVAITLLVEVYKQVNALETRSPEYLEFSIDSGTSAKRRKVLKGIDCILDNIKTDNDESSAWLCFIEKLLLKYPEVMKVHEFETVFLYLIDALPSSTTPNQIRCLLRCAAAAVQSIKVYLADLSFEKSSLLQDLEKLMNVALSFLSSSKKICAKYLEEAHLLVQAILLCKLCPSSTAQLVLKLYLDNIVPLNALELQTFIVVCRVINFPETSSTRLKLLQWLIAGRDIDRVNLAKDVALASLTLLCRIPSDSPIFLSPSPILCNEIEVYHLQCSLDDPPPAIDRPIEKSYFNQLNEKSVIEALKSQFLQTLSERCSDMETMNDPLVILSHTMLIYLFYQVAWNSGDHWGLSWEDLYSKSCFRLVTVLESLLKHWKNEEPVTDLLEAMSEFFQVIKQTPKLASNIRTKKIGKYLFLLVQRAHHQYQVSENDDQEMNAVQRNDFESLLSQATGEPVLPLIVSDSLKILAYMTYDGHETSDLESRLIEYCCTQIDLNSPNGFKMAMIVLENLLYKVSGEKLLSDDMLTLVFTLVRTWYKHHDETIRLLNFLKDLVPLVFKTADEAKYVRFCQLVSKCGVLLMKKFSAPVQVAFTHVYGTVLKMKFCVLRKDSDGFAWNEEFCKSIWSNPVMTPVFQKFEWLINLNDEQTKKSLHLPLFLQNRFNEVRTVISDYITYVYKFDPICDDDAILQELVFNDIVLSSMEIFSVDGAEMETIDVTEELMLRSCCALRYLTSIIATSPTYRQKALFSFFELVANKRISTELALKALRHVKKVLNLPSLEPFLNENMNFVLHSWFKKYALFERLPYQLLGCRTYEEFLVNYKSLIILLLLEEGDHDRMLDISNRIADTLPDIIKECFPVLMGATLSKKSDGISTSLAETMSSILKREIGSDNLKLYLGKDLDKVLIAVYKKLHDESHFVKLCGELNGAKFPQSTHSSIEFSTIRNVCNYLETEAHKTNIFEYLCREHCIHMHSIIHALRLSISEASTNESRYLCFHQFVTFCYSLAEISPLLDSFSGYFVRCVVHQLLNLSDSNLGQHAVVFLFRFLSKCLPANAFFVNDLVSFIVPKMASIIMKNREKCEAISSMAGAVLKLLLVNHASSLPSVDALDPLPHSITSSKFVDSDVENRELLRKRNQTLEQSIEQFLKAGSRAHDIAFREQGLHHLHQQLCSKRIELHNMYLQLKSMRNFSEQCASSVLHRLIISLVELATSRCSQVSELAAVCLGEIGPRDLTTLVLKPQPRYGPPALPTALTMMLLPLLVSDNTILTTGAANTLQLLFKTKEGYAIVTNEKEENAGGRLSQIELSYVAPFKKESSKTKKPFSRETNSTMLEGSLSNWCPVDDEISHSEWLTNLVISILKCCPDSSFFKCLIPIVQINLAIAEGLLPYLAKMILEFNNRCAPLLDGKVKKFFEKHYAMSQSKDPRLSSIYMNRAAVQSMLSLVNFCRLSKSSSKSSSSQLNLNYLHVASAANYCNAYFTAVFYAELWTDSELSKYDCYQGSSTMSQLDMLSAVDRLNAQVLQGLLWESYEKIGENDAVHGCGDAHISSAQGRIKFYLQMKDWSQVISECELLLDDAYEDYRMYSLRMCGMYQMATHHSKTQDYECAWRLSNWSLEPNEDDYSSLLYSGIMSVCTESCNETRDLYVRKARNFVVENYLRNASLEVANSLYEPLSKLCTLREVETEIPQDQELNDFSYLSQDVGRWEDLEPILSVKKIVSPLELRSLVCLESASLARKAGAVLIAHRFLQGVNSTNPDVLHRCILEEAKLVWDSGCSLRAKYLLKDLLAKENVSSDVMSSALITYGSWLADSKTEQTNDIMKNHFEKAAALVAGQGKKNQLDVADCLGRFADSEYERLQLYKKSEEYSRKESRLRKYKEKLNELKSLSTTADAKYKLTLQGQYKADLAEFQVLNQSHAVYLNLAIEQYMTCLMLDDHEGNDLKVFRIVSLWLENKTNSLLIERIVSDVRNIPSYKFLVVLNQLIVRLTDEQSSVNVLLESIIRKCCIEHPHHSLPLVLALANAYLDDSFKFDATGKAITGRKAVGILESRIKVIKQLIKKLEREVPISEILKHMTKLVHAYVSLANYPSGKKVGDFQLPSSQPLSKLANLPIPCITANIPVRKNGVYLNFPEITKFEQKFSLVGGINSPKKIHCKCSDGETYVQLVKGEDDLRQDAGMQQVFIIMNILLRNEESTSKRRLLIRTYRVVPTSQKSGVIEWVSNTQPIGEYLVSTSSKKGAHERLRPQDMSPQEARKLLIEAHTEKRSAEEKYQLYSTICSRLKPVFRYFFTEKYPTPGVWFERRLAYTRSIATNSMVGYVLGIGDRHVANILIDLFTAEVVHIDFGVTFEFGRFLPTPELIPFRLTRDIVDGMGVSGTEGIFRRCCEETLSVLRKAKVPILTTLEVFLYDPLATWDASVKKVAAKRDQSDTIHINSDELGDNDRNVNSLAERAVQRLKEKLEGREEGSATSVEGQVSYLISSARNPRNLCSLFNGWQAYL